MDGASTTFFTKPSLTPERKEFYDRLNARGAAPLWEVLGAIIPPEPRPEAVPVLWHYEDLRPLLMEAGRLLTEKEAERRVLDSREPRTPRPFARHRQSLRRSAVDSSGRGRPLSSSRDVGAAVCHRGHWRVHRRGRRAHEDEPGRLHPDAVVDVSRSRQSW